MRVYLVHYVDMCLYALARVVSPMCLFVFVIACMFLHLIACVYVFVSVWVCVCVCLGLIVCACQS